MRRKLIYSLIGLVGCTWLAGCQEKPEGAQTIIIELADPTDMQENNTAVEGEIEAEESASEADAETMTDSCCAGNHRIFGWCRIELYTDQLK